MSPRSDVTNELDIKKLKSCELAGVQAVPEVEEKNGLKYNNNSFDLFELRAWIFLALGYALGVYILYKLGGYLGISMDVVVLALIICTLFDVTVSQWNIKYGERTLYLRTLKKSGAELKKQHNEGERVKDPWKKAEDEFGLFFADQIDYAVMKYVGKDVPLLVEQEYRHATMHVSAQKELTEEEEKAKASNGINFWRKLLLRRGDRIGILLCGMIEAGNIYGTFLQILLQNAPMNVMRFHIFEEAEHASLTVNNLKRKNTSIERFLAFPLLVGLMSASMIGIIGPIMRDPKMLIQLDMYPIILYNLLRSIAIPTATLLSILVHYVLPFPTIASLHKIVWLTMREECKENGIEWEVETKATYPLYL